MRILVVEDERSLADIICLKLSMEKYEVDVSYDGEDGLNNGLSDIYDLIILDIMLPKIDGIKILSELKKNNISSKIIMLTAKSSLEDKLIGFDNGANDYLTKPFHMEELIARVNAILRNDCYDKINDVISFSDISLYVKTSKLLCNGDMVDVSKKEFLILELFMNNPNQIISKERIYDKIWGYDVNFESNNLEAYLSFIRKKLKLIDSKVMIKSVRGLGYKMEG